MQILIVFILSFGGTFCYIMTIRHYNHDSDSVPIIALNQQAYSLMDYGYMIEGYSIYNNGVQLFKGVESAGAVNVYFYNGVSYRQIGNVLPEYYYQFILDYEAGTL